MNSLQSAVLNEGLILDVLFENTSVTLWIPIVQ